MRVADVVIVGGGPAGSSCARDLVASGFDVVVLDRERFPRTKLCAGWVTPEALADLDLTEDDYPHRFMTFDKLQLHWKWLKLSHSSTQHSIRRYEFDDFLLRRSGAEVAQHKVRNIERDGVDYVIDGAFRCRYVVGAAGTACPVYKTFFHEVNPRNRDLQTATLEQEYPFQWKTADCHLWFFKSGLPGYAWYVPKEDGYLNVGLGGMAVRLKEGDKHLQAYWNSFVEYLRRRDFIDDTALDPKGYSYYLRGNVDTVRIGNAFIVGDSAGLATRDMCEGIGPAIRSGKLAAKSIADDSEYSLSALMGYSGQSIVSKWLERSFAGARLNS
ncbi:MAG: NAD(P)/FAD-dependent oxidoreductase [Gammaproteobacteria bacterium]|nr:NAD(P)/FAD-dependent oxidoreductase [Gammaproteobacteria bacterium]MDH4314268.1 NAD(P)/FAD-dependent oxidoreductase [Gammaproteobacteria bacterium]MDH5213653.1 NAD(P)/FAD-dependent oxidoreductase [Gammaproteobacteria bacterium]MDH5500084.1 NAD(P)/FAD-dependent oxidoreductase [Gammaproteobacteria bacterium]